MATNYRPKRRDEMYKTQIDGKTVYVYSEQEHLKALGYENISLKAKRLIELLGGDEHD